MSATQRQLDAWKRAYKDRLPLTDADFEKRYGLTRKKFDHITRRMDFVCCGVLDPMTVVKKQFNKG